jgi:pimeloyl-ACP methyl ester carboxylesterase
MDVKKSGRKKMAVILGIIAGAAAILAVLANVTYAPALRDENGKKIAKGEKAVAELIAIDVNGSRQWISVRGQDRDAPVLLFVHGGPGSPETTMTRKYFAGKIEKNFVVVSWEQRGSAKSYDARGATPLTIDAMVEDGRAVTDYLRDRFGKDKIYLAGHSWGTTLGSLLVSKYPEKFAGYCAIGQVVYGVDNERISYAWALEQARARGDAKGIKALESIAEYGENPRVDWMRRIMLERKWLGVYGGATGHDPSYMNRLIIDAMFLSPEYSFMDKVNFLRGSMQSLRDLWPAELETDLRKEVPRLSVPVLMIAGRYDFNTPCTLAESYFSGLEAPEKKFVWFENSAHSPCFEESAKFADVLTDFFLKK